MSPTLLQLRRDSDGIAVITIDLPARSMNVLSSELLRELDEAVAELAADPGVVGVLLRSAKRAFLAGADLIDLAARFERGISVPEAFAVSNTGSCIFRRMETCGKPVAVAINGAALGGGLELALAAHYRVLADDPRAVVGLPEVRVGLLPGGGGTQRLLRMLGPANALPLLLEGTALEPTAALQLGIVDELAPLEDIERRARAWLLSRPDCSKPWDRKDYVVPGTADPAFAQLLTATTARTARGAQHNYPAPVAILSCVYEGARLPIDAALRIESKYFAPLLAGPVARNMMRTLFINKGRADKLAARPAEIARREFRRIGVIGAGMMGAGIALASAQVGLEVVLLDRTLEEAVSGRERLRARLELEVARGRTIAATADAWLARVTPKAEPADLAGCDLVVEAVFEDREVKARVTRGCEPCLGVETIMGTNTSTLPITGLAAHSVRPERFIGLHFFSPVERMPLVEVIRGELTSRQTLAEALDFVAQLRKTPIVVNDRRGFYTSRVFSTYLNEGMRMLEEGIHPALIENAARHAGMPFGPLAVADEVSLDLQLAAVRQSMADLGDGYSPPVGHAVMRRFVEDLGRLGRKTRGGFYEYSIDGQKSLWQGLGDLYPRRNQQPSADEVGQRLLYIQSLESARCLDENVVTSAADADVGSVLGFGFPGHTGGTISLIDTVGVARFVAECEALAEHCGPRFLPSSRLRERASLASSFHPS